MMNTRTRECSIVNYATGQSLHYLACAACLLLIPFGLWSCGPTMQDQPKTAATQGNAGSMNIPVELSLGRLRSGAADSLPSKRFDYGSIGDVVQYDGSVAVAVTTYEGKRVVIPPALVKVFHNRDDKVKAVSTWPMPHPMDFVGAVDWLERWMAANEIEPDQRMKEQLKNWKLSPRPGNELGPNHIPDQEQYVADLTPTSALIFRWQPDPSRGWVLLLGVSLKVDELMELDRVPSSPQTEKASGGTPASRI